jgi:thiol:disulfide interchange protein
MRNLRKACLWVLCGGATLALSLGTLAQADDGDPFSLANKAEPRATPGAVMDPFDPAYKFEAQKAPPTKGSTAGKKGVGALIDFTVALEPKETQPGQVVKLTITGVPKPGHHTYSFTKKTPIQDSPGRFNSLLKFKNISALRPLWPLLESEPEMVNETGLGYYLEHSKKFTLSQDILVLPDATEGSHILSIEVHLQVCDDKTCLPGIVPLEGIVQVKGAPAKLSDEVEKRLAEKEPPLAVVQPPAGAPGVSNGDSLPADLIAFILSGIFWGAVSLITPCVFPMIPITVSYFLKQSEKEHHKPITMALVYCATIVVVLTIAAVALLSFFRGLSTNPIMNFVIGGLFIFFALSLFGMYEIELPSGLARFTSAREGKGGLVGTMFMALTFTIISFACVAPFLGGFGGTAANSSLTLTHRLLGGLAFAVTFASPFFILALFPTLLKKLPKSGSWLNTVKVVMGFLELGAALKFLRAGELVIAPTPVFFTYDFVLGLFIALSLLCGLYLLNLYRLPHDTPAEHLSVPRLLFSLGFLGLALYLTPGLFKVGDKGQSQRPGGVIFAWLDSFLLPDEQETDLPWIGDLQKGLAEARAKRKLVFVDFTGVTCNNCRLNERDVFPMPTIKELLRRFELVQLYTDKVPDKFYPPEVQATFGSGAGRQREDAQKNLEFQKKTFDTEELPLYVVLEPLENGTFKELGHYGGRIYNQSNFAQFLQTALAANPSRPLATQVARND